MHLVDKKLVKVLQDAVHANQIRLYFLILTHPIPLDLSLKGSWPKTVWKRLYASSISTGHPGVGLSGSWNPLPPTYPHLKGQQDPASKIYIVASIFYANTNPALLLNPCIEIWLVPGILREPILLGLAWPLSIVVCDRESITRPLDLIRQVHLSMRTQNVWRMNYHNQLRTCALCATSVLLLWHELHCCTTPGRSLHPKTPL